MDKKELLTYINKELYNAGKKISELPEEFTCIEESLDFNYFDGYITALMGVKAIIEQQDKEKISKFLLKQRGLK